MTATPSVTNGDGNGVHEAGKWGHDQSLLNQVKFTATRISERKQQPFTGTNTATTEHENLHHWTRKSVPKLLHGTVCQIFFPSPSLAFYISIISENKPNETITETQMRVNENRKKIVIKIENVLIHWLNLEQLEILNVKPLIPMFGLLMRNCWFFKQKHRKKKKKKRNKK